MAKQTIDLKALLESKLGDVEPLQSSFSAIENAGRQIPNNLFYEANSGEFVPETIASDYGSLRPLSIEEAQEFEAKINACIEQLFQEGVHYGLVTGVKKKFLFKAGAEVIANMLGLVVRTEIIDKVEDYANGYFSYTCKTWLMVMITPVQMLMYGKEASNRKQEIDRQHYTIPNQRPKDKHCGKI